MSDITTAQPGKNYAIMRVERIGTLSEMRRIEQHNTREKLSENIEPGGPPPRELLPDAHADTIAGARERMAELQLDPAKVAGAVGVEMILTTSPGWWDTATGQMKQDWVTDNVTYLRDKFGRALLSAKLHEDEKTPHIHAVALAAVSKVDGVRGPKPKTEEGKDRRRQEQAKRTARWRWNYRDLFGQDFEHLSREQDRYHAAVAHLGLARGERHREVTDVVMEHGVIVQAAQVSRGKRRDGTDRPRRTITTQQHQAAARDDRARATEELRQAEQLRAAAGEVMRAAHEERETAALVTRQPEQERTAAAEAMRRADEDRRVAAAERAETARLRAEQEATIARQQREVDDLRAAAATERDAAERHRIDLDTARAVMIALRDRATADAGAAARTRQEAEVAADRTRQEAAAAAAAASAERAAMAATRSRIEEARRHDEALLALLARAADDRAGLNLRLAGDTFAIGPHGLTDDENATKKKGWPKPLMAMARALAAALDRVRTIARHLDQRERVIEERATDIAERDARLAREQAGREAQLVQDRAAHDDRVAAHQRAIDDLNRRDAAVKVEERRVADAAAAAEAQRKAAVAAQASADATLRDHHRWIEITDALEREPRWVEVGPGGTLVLDRYAAAANPALAKAFDNTPPEWMVSLSVQRLDLVDALQRADDREKGAAYAAERLEAMIAKAGPVLTPAQQGIANEATRTVRQFRPRSDGWER